jgi:hypothetical protein
MGNYSEEVKDMQAVARLGNDEAKKWCGDKGIEW